MTDIFIPSKVKIGFSTPWDQKNSAWGFNGTVLCHAAHFNRKGTLNGRKRFEQDCHVTHGITEGDNKPEKGFSVGYNHQDVDDDKKNGGLWVKRPDNSFLHLGNAASALLLANAEISQGEIKNPCVMGWSNGAIYLLPVGSFAHDQASKFTELQHVNISQEDLIHGGVYVRKLDSKTAIYLGRRDLQNIVGHSEEAVNKSLGQRNIFYFDGVWQVMAADSFSRMDGCVSEDQITQHITDYEEHQKRTLLGEIVFLDPDFKKIFDKMGNCTFVLDFAVEHDGEFCKVANMRIDKNYSDIPGVLFINDKGIYNDHGFSNVKFTLSPFQNAFLKQLKEDSFESLKSWSRQHDSGDYFSNLEKKMAIVGMKIICRKVGDYILPLNTPRCNELTGLLTGINPQDNSWALD